MHMLIVRRKAVLTGAVPTHTSKAPHVSLFQGKFTHKLVMIFMCVCACYICMYMHVCKYAYTCLYVYIFICTFCTCHVNHNLSITQDSCRMHVCIRRIMYACTRVYMHTAHTYIHRYHMYYLEQACPQLPNSFMCVYTCWRI
jgi:hypothetical protein